MEKNVLQTDLSGKVALVNHFHAAIKQHVAEIMAEGGIAKAYKGNGLPIDGDV